ncbi:conserved hypothetical protein [Treponema primitia ZAS-2]|uniref:Double zinc ribbon domain-containing protein n=1 Tax=Treponema primitia (strain ATCC BAA-887 / DSM 12427 / ZAS-2) TaxID=545694 RepID=F5YRA4_TREPZ|nr:double zinc ribbon domain-containing protein [Treponema primitia]AEF85589.1 conserved hypothetical protein [Treponema primitia ZAS-2]
MTNSFTNHAAQAAAYVREYLFPAGCPICGTELLDPKEAWYGICGPCMETLVMDNGSRCSSCGRPLISEQEQCLQCREGEGGGPGSRAFDGAVSIFPYTGRYLKLLGAYKFGKNLALANFLAEKIPEALARLNRNAGETVLVPVPPRPGKIRKAGWDQVAYLGKILERNASKTNAYTVYPCLKRLPSKTQKKLDKADRKLNLRGKILCTRPAPREAVLFDDVFTTGATLEACASALKEAGTEKVWAISLFYG